MLQIIVDKLIITNMASLTNRNGIAFEFCGYAKIVNRQSIGVILLLPKQFRDMEAERRCRWRPVLI